jgi:hypothetical protein
MNKEKQIEKFINEAIKGRVLIFDHPKLLILLQQMETREIQIFWIQYSATRSFSQANITFPDWKSKEQEKYLKEGLSSFQYYPKEKDLNGQYTVDKNDLIDHVRKHLENIINQEIVSNEVFRNKAFLEKMPTYILAAVLIMIPFFIISSIYSNNSIFRVILIGCYVFYGMCLLIYLLLINLIKREQKRSSQ